MLRGQAVEPVPQPQKLSRRLPFPRIVSEPQRLQVLRDGRVQPCALGLLRPQPATPVGARWWTMCCTQAKLALPLGGVPYRHRRSSASRSPPQSETLKGGLARMKSALRSGWRSSWKLSPWAIRPSMPRMARFIFASRQVV